jgi:anti-anti-sigma regulatory factor
MRRVTVHDHGPVVVIEVDGDLDTIAGHDLRKALETVLQTTTGTINLDLSRVGAADADGIVTLTWCSRAAIAVGRRLMWSRCSQPLAADLRASHRRAHGNRHEQPTRPESPKRSSCSTHP